MTPKKCSVLSMCLTCAKVDAVKTAVKLGCGWVVTVFDREASSCYHNCGLDVQDINLSLEFKYSNISDHLSIEALLAKIHGELNR